MSVSHQDESKSQNLTRHPGHAPTVRARLKGGAGGNESMGACLEQYPAVAFCGPLLGLFSRQYQNQCWANLRRTMKRTAVIKARQLSLTEAMLAYSLLPSTSIYRASNASKASEPPHPVQKYQLAEPSF